MKILFKYLKRFILGSFMLYSYNLIVSSISLNITLPINFFTIVIITLFDIPGIVALIVLKTIGL